MRRRAAARWGQPIGRAGQRLRTSAAAAAWLMLFVVGCGEGSTGQPDGSVTAPVDVAAKTGDRGSGGAASPADSGLPPALDAAGPATYLCGPGVHCDGEQICRHTRSAGCALPDRFEDPCPAGCVPCPESGGCSCDTYACEANWRGCDDCSCVTTGDAEACGCARGPMGRFTLECPAPPLTPFAAGQEWKGTYFECPQGTTELNLQIQAVSGLDVDAIFDFTYVPDQIHGAFTVSGTYDPRARRITFARGEWIDKPPTYIMVDMVGTVSADGLEFHGLITEGSCQKFRVRLQD